MSEVRSEKFVICYWYLERLPLAFTPEDESEKQLHHNKLFHCF